MRYASDRSARETFQSKWVKKQKNNMNFIFNNVGFCITVSAYDNMIKIEYLWTHWAVMTVDFLEGHVSPLLLF